MTSHYAQRAWIHSGPACPPLVTGFGCSFSVPWCPGPFQFPPPLPTLQPLPTFTQGSYPLIYSNISPLLPGVLVQEGSQSNISEQGRQWLCPQWTNNTKALSLSLGSDSLSLTPNPGLPGLSQQTKVREIDFSSPENKCIILGHRLRVKRNICLFLFFFFHIKRSGVWSVAWHLLDASTIFPE